MPKRKLSNGFAGASTRVVGEVDKEVESRLRKRLDVFTDDFSPPGTGESFAGGDYSKSHNGYGKAHDDSIPETDPSFTLEEGDDQQEVEGGIKPPCSQFPGKLKQKSLKSGASDNAEFDPHQTDPARLTHMDEQKALALIEKRMAEFKENGGK